VKARVTVMPAVAVHLFGPNYRREARQKRSDTKEHKKHKTH
jgi:hypothetical protein